jgi:AraC-like DNA-binding protein
MYDFPVNDRHLRPERLNTLSAHGPSGAVTNHLQATERMLWTHATGNNAKQCSLPRGYATILLTIKGLIRHRECHPEDASAFDDIGLSEGAIVAIMQDGEQFSHRAHCASVPLRNAQGQPVSIVGLCFLSQSSLATALALGLMRGAIDAISYAPDEVRYQGTSAFGNSGPELPPLRQCSEDVPSRQATNKARLTRGGLAPHVLRKVEHYLDEHLPDSISLGELAAIASLSVSHFAREFKRSLGFAPYHYIQQRRLQIAATVVVKTVRPLADIALEMGFADQSHFSRSFTRAFGTTPRDFRRAHTVA